MTHSTNTNYDMISVYADASTKGRVFGVFVYICYKLKK